MLTLQRATEQQTVMQQLTVIGTLAVDGWAVTLGTTWIEGLGGLRPAHSRLRCTKCNSTTTNGQYTNFMLNDVAL